MIHDLTVSISENMVIWPGDPSIEIKIIKSMEKGDPVNVMKLVLSTHTGTHVDAPHHFLNNYSTIEKLPLDDLIGPCYVCQLPYDIDHIDAGLLENISLKPGITRILFGTRNSSYWLDPIPRFRDNFVAITKNGAEWLASRSIKLVGIDYLSVATSEDPKTIHNIFFNKKIVVVECLNLHNIASGFYDLYCLPLRIIGADGSPARVILVDHQ